MKHDISWVLDAPRETYVTFLSEPSKPRAWMLVLLGAVASAAVADATLVPALAPRLAFTLVSFLVAFSLSIVLFFELSRLFGARAIPWTTWLRCGAVAIVPAFLLLPLALTLKPLGGAGFVLYELLKLVVAAAIVRRTVWAIEALNGWPAWASSLLLIGPFALTFAMMITLALAGLLILGASLWRM